MPISQDIAQTILQIFSNPAWGGIGVIISSILSIIAIILTQRTKNSRFQEPQTTLNNQMRVPIASNKTRLFLRDGYHRAFLAQELIKDLDVIDSTNLNKYVSPMKKN